MEIRFQALEYKAKNDFGLAEYLFSGEHNTGWEILRNGEPHLMLGKGYRLLQSRVCGICATDIDRHFLPFPLPQIIGHEVVAQSLDGKQRYVVEINDSPFYRGESDIFGDSGLPTHTPGRMCLGIDRLPGGFGPYILAPQHAIIPVDDIDDGTAVLIEPFAAALQAVIASPPFGGSSVAVLGPRRLGALLIAALSTYRDMSGSRYSINALSRHKEILNVCMKLGADYGVDLSLNSHGSSSDKFDIVYDTTGTVSGFEQALMLARQEIHLKSTNGQPMCGLNNLTAFVVDELALLPFTSEHLDFCWPNETRRNQTIYCAPGAQGLMISGRTVYGGDVSGAEAVLHGNAFAGRLPRFDLAVASSPVEIDAITRPSQANENSLVRPRGAILFAGDPGENLLLNFLARGGRLRSSRCGDFHTALQIVRGHRSVVNNLAHYLISHLFPVRELPTAFGYAQDKRAYKVIVKHS